MLIQVRVAVEQWSTYQELALSSKRVGSSSERNVPENCKESLNFNVSPELKREFKGFAVSKGINMTDLLNEGFALSKEKQPK